MVAGSCVRAARRIFHPQSPDLKSCTGSTLGRIESAMLPKSLRPLKPYLWKYRWEYLFSAFTVIANNAIWVQFALVIKQAIGDLDRGIMRSIPLYSLELLA